MSIDLKIPGLKDFLKYVYGLWPFILIIVCLFAIFLALGYSIAIFFPDLTGEVMSGIETQVSPLKDLSPVGLMIGIFLNNAVKCFVVLILGILFGIVPLLFIMANGIGIGIVIGATAVKTGLLYVFIGLLPHGVLELPLVFISAAIGLKLGYDLLRAIVKRDVNIAGEFVDALKIFLVWLMPLFLVSAFIETFITATLLTILFGTTF
jgi:stage II sporulation protein M